ncbi:MAG: ABC transporter permease, partial [Coprothermobacterota bacterium]|nr:ABC transporter permease [Coprothermobacterota bacterium]
MNRRVFFRKLFQALLTIFIILVINYFLFRVMPGDPAAMLVRNPRMSPEAVQKVSEMFGLGKPWYEQFGIYLANLAQGNLGTSFIYKAPVTGIIMERLLATLLLTVVAEVLAILGGVLLGIVAAWKRGKKVDVAALGFALVTYAMPTFWLGILMVVFFAVTLRWFPTSGMMTPSLSLAGFWQQVPDVLWHMVLPSVTLALVLMGEYALIMRNSLVDVLTEDYITTARAKGAPERRVLRSHALPNAMIPMVTIIAMNLSFTITGALQVETVFSWPGLG